MGVGVMLMVFPYFISNAIVMVVVCVAVAALPFIGARRA